MFNFLLFKTCYVDTHAITCSSPRGWRRHTQEAGGDQEVCRPLVDTI